MCCLGSDVGISRKRALDYAEELISVPRAHVRVKLRQTQSAVTLIHQGRTLTKCYITNTGMTAATYMAEALGIKLPSLGETVDASVSTGVLWRAISISCLDFRKGVSFVLLERLLEEAHMQRGFNSGSV